MAAVKFSIYGNLNVLDKRMLTLEERGEGGLLVREYLFGMSGASCDCCYGTSWQVILLLCVGLE